MKRFLIGIALVSGLIGQVFGAVDPNVKLSDLQGVVDNCALVASAETPEGNPHAGLCIGSTQSYLDALRAMDPPITVDALDQDITDLVLALVPLAQQDAACNSIDDEIARAIELASTYASTDAQKAQLVQISQTVASCADDGTGALPVDVVPSPTV